MVSKKMKHVLLPTNSDPEATIKELRDWDLWGPLLICLFLSVVLSITAPEGQASLVFTAVFVIVWCGAGVVTLNAQLLGAKVSFFQSICIIGYCLFPLTVSSFINLLNPFNILLVKLIIVILGFMWSTRASVVFMAGCVEENRRLLAVYPVFLFYIIIGWMILLQ
jgi:hypothetical protein